jgi:hypothetical protein
MAAQVPEPVQRPHQTQSDAGALGRLQAPDQRRPQVVMFSLQACQLSNLLPPAKFHFRFFGERQEELRMAPPGGLELAICLQLLQPVFADRFEHLESRFAVRPLCPSQQAFVDKRSHHTEAIGKG